MKTFYMKSRFLAAVLFVASTSIVTINNMNAQTMIGTIGAAYTQNFNTLTTAGSWTDNSTIPNWYSLDLTGSAPASFVLNDGDASTAGFTSFGTVANSDRALGYASIGNIGDNMYIGWYLQNNTNTKIINSLIVKWKGEQWRVENSDEQQIELLYYIPSAVTELDVSNLQNQGHFIQSKKFNIPAAKLDGNLSENSTLNIDTIFQTLNPGEKIVLVWRFTYNDINQLMAIDDIEVSARESQTISNFSLPTGKVFGDADFSTSATATSGLPISYSSSNPNVAIGNGSNIKITGPGSATITAIQLGNSIYSSASSAGLVLTVKPKTPVPLEATSISSTGFTANWTADNGLNDANVRYVLEYSLLSDFSTKTTTTYTAKTAALTGLTSDKVYYYKLRGRVYVGSSPTSNYSSYTLSSAITTGSDYRSNGDGEWNDAGKWTVKSGGNWVVNSSNSIANSIEIAHNCTINTNSVINESAIINTNSLLIRSNAKLVTNKQINVFNELIIEVAADGTSGQILNSGNISVGVNAKIIVRKTFSAPVKWHFMGFPFDVAAADIFSGGTSSSLTWGDLNSGANFVVQQYNGDFRASAGTAEVVNQGLHWGNVSPKVFTAKRGYIVYKTTPGTIDFTARGGSIGSFFSTSGASVPAGRFVASQQIHSYWNLICSPFSSIYDLAYTSPSTTYYAYNGTNYSTSLAGEQLNIQPFSAFFLQAPSTSIGFNNLVVGQGRKVSSVSNKEVSNVDEVYLNLSNGNSLYDDLTRIRLQEGASADYVIGTDAAKMFGMDPNVSYIYSTINGYGIAINTLPATTSNVELQTKFAATGNYTISILNTDKISNYSAVILYDKVLGKNVDLLSVGSYTFSSSLAGTTNRFTVKLSPKITTGISQSENGKITVSSVGNNVTVAGLSSVANITVYDTAGKIAFKGLVENNQSIRLNNKGLYIFEISDNNIRENIKVFIK